MTPYGFFVRQQRNSRSLKLKDMAIALGLKSTYLSSLELGKKGKINQQIVNASAKYLELNRAQRKELEHAAKISDRTLFIPACAHPHAYETAHLFVRHLDQLSDYQLSLISAVITMDEQYSSSDRKRIHDGNIRSNEENNKEERLCI